MNDTFEVPTRGHGPAVRVKDWRTTIERGFGSIMSASGAGSSRGDEPALVVRLERADLALVDKRRIDRDRRRNVGRLAFAGDDEQQPVILAHGGHTHINTSAPRAVAVYAEIAYAADLVDETGRVLARASGSVLSEGPTSPTVSAAEVVRSAVERLVEEVFLGLQPRRDPAGGTAR